MGDVSYCPFNRGTGKQRFQLGFDIHPERRKPFFQEGRTMFDVRQPARKGRCLIEFPFLHHRLLQNLQLRSDAFRRKVDLSNRPGEQLSDFSARFMRWSESISWAPFAACGVFFTQDYGQFFELAPAPAGKAGVGVSSFVERDREPIKSLLIDWWCVGHLRIQRWGTTFTGPRRRNQPRFSRASGRR